MEKRLDEARAEMDEVCRRECLNFIFLCGVFGADICLFQCRKNVKPVKR